MLTPDYLEHVADDLVRLYAQLEVSIIEDISRRITKTGLASDTALWQLEKLRQAGGVYNDALNQISKVTGMSEGELEKLFEKSAAKTMTFDDEVYRRAGLNPIPIRQSPAMLRALTAGLRKTNGLVHNLTMTTANSAQTSFIQACDLGHMQVISGAFDYNTAVRTAVKAAAKDGLKVLYPKGGSAQLDVAVRRAVLTGVSQTCGELQMIRAKEMECDLVETTAHMGARLEHSYWQGQVFSRGGISDKYPEFVAATGYGTGAGLMGWNCRHNFYPFYDEFSKRSYTSKELKELDDHRVSYEGEEYSDYEASQIQRRLERNIRATKRELAGLESAAKAVTNDETKSGLTAEIRTTAGKLSVQRAKMRNFIKQTGRNKEPARVRI